MAVSLSFVSKGIPKHVAASSLVPHILGNGSPFSSIVAYAPWVTSHALLCKSASGDRVEGPGGLNRPMTSGLNQRCRPSRYIFVCGALVLDRRGGLCTVHLSIVM